MESQNETLNTLSEYLSNEKNNEFGSNVELFRNNLISLLHFTNLLELDLPGSKYFHLSDADITFITTGFTAFNIKLQRLSLRNHNISDASFRIICSGIVHSGELELLDLEGNDIEGLYLHFLQLSSPDCTLKSLNLSHNPLQVISGMNLANDYRANKSCLSLKLNHCNLPLNVIIAFATTLRQNETLKTLHLDRPLLTCKKSEEGIGKTT